MSEMHDIVRKLMGSIEPWGDINIDSDRYSNLLEYGTLTHQLVKDLVFVASFRNREEYSIGKLGREAYRILEDISEVIAKIIK